MPRPREHDENTRRRLIERAGAILDEEGLAGLSTRRLAVDLGTTTRAVYSLFGDKAGLLRALYRAGFETLRAQTEAVPVTDDPARDIVALAEAYRASARQNRNLYALMFDMVPGWRPGREEQAAARTTLRPLAGAVGRAIERRLLPDDVRGLTTELFALVHGLASLELAGLLGGADEASARWESAVVAAIRGYGVTMAGQQA
jgi:AcrR family transcriptional regulator